VTAAIYVERSPQHGQIVREIVEVSSVVERTAARPSFSPLFIACLINKVTFSRESRGKTEVSVLVR
jgi:hypothetical protein